MTRITKAGCFGLAIALTAGLPVEAQACAACMGDPNSRFADATSNLVFIMLGLVGMVMAGTGAVAWSFYRRALSPLPPHIQLVEQMPEDNNDASSGQNRGHF